MAKTLPADDDETYLCWSCVGETFLSDQIRKQGQVATCSFCSEKHEALPLEQVADIFELAFNSHYRRTRTGPINLEEAMYRHGISTDLHGIGDGEPVTDASRVCRLTFRQRSPRLQIRVIPRRASRKSRGL